MLNKIAVRGEDGFIVLVPRDEYMKKHNTKCAFSEKPTVKKDTVEDDLNRHKPGIGEHNVIQIIPPEQSNIFALGMESPRLSNAAQYRIRDSFPKSWIYRAWNLIVSHVDWNSKSDFAPHFNKLKHKEPFRHVLVIGVMLKVVMRQKDGTNTNLDSIAAAWRRTENASSTPARKGDISPNNRIANKYVIVTSYDDYEHLFRAATDIYVNKWKSYYNEMMNTSSREVYIISKVMIVFDDKTCSAFYGNDALQQMWHKLEIH